MCAFLYNLFIISKRHLFINRFFLQCAKNKQSVWFKGHMKIECDFLAVDLVHLLILTLFFKCFFNWILRWTSFDSFIKYAHINDASGIKRVGTVLMYQVWRRTKLRWSCVFVFCKTKQSVREKELSYFIYIKRYGVLMLVELITVFPVAHMFSRLPNSNNTEKRSHVQQQKQKKKQQCQLRTEQKKCNYNSKCEQNLSSKPARVRGRENENENENETNINVAKRWKKIISYTNCSAQYMCVCVVSVVSRARFAMFQMSMMLQWTSHRQIDVCIESDQSH